MTLPANRYCYRWAWGPTIKRNRAGDPLVVRALGRKHQRCRVICRGAMNSALIEFEEDGYRVVTSRNGLRRA